MTRGRRVPIGAAAALLVLLAGAYAISAVEPGTAVKEDRKSVSAGADSCIQCHGELQGKLSAPIAEWRGSVHAKKGGGCVICHGGDPGALDKKLAKSRNAGYLGMPNGRKIDELCGRDECHPTAAEEFRKSRHYGSMKRTGRPGCTNCHGSHGIQRSSINIISDRTCSDCHSVEYSREVISLIFNLEKGINSIEKSIEMMEERSADVGDIKDGVRRTKQLYHQMVHVCSREDMQFTKKILELEVKSLKDRADLKLSTMGRLDFIYISTVVFCLLVTAGIGVYTIYMYSKRKKTE